MSTITLQQKVYRSFSPKIFEPHLKSLCEGLNVKLKVLSETNHNWIQVHIAGEDKDVVLNLLKQEIGLAPLSLNNLKRFSVTHGKILSHQKNETGLTVDIGITLPERYFAIVPLSRLQMQLSDGTEIPFRQLTQLFCLRNHFPLEIRTTDKMDRQNRFVDAELSEGQLSLYSQWIRSHLDRLVVIGTMRSQIIRALKKSNLTRDVIEVESLGLLESAILCKLGTDASGLIPKLGNHLPTSILAPFSPRTIRKTINKPFFN